MKCWGMLSYISRTTIELKDQLLHVAQKLTGLKTKRAVVNRALELLVRTEKRKGLLRYYGRGVWKGDLRVMRRNRA
jgi:Arc/MetJ family transcription regulator